MAALLDHFRPPISLRRHWHAFPNAWATYLASDLNRQLPESYFAEANVQFGIEIDVATFEEADVLSSAPLATAVATWTAPPPTLTVPLAPLTDIVEVLIFDQQEGPTLAGAIELISPANKDRPTHRDAFVSKCAAYVQQGIGLILVDVVTDRSANLHTELLERLQSLPSRPMGSDLYAVAYRPISRAGTTQLDIWEETLELDRPLPTMPLGLRGGLCLPVDLDASYDRTCREQRMPVGEG
jgi:hypothetical protein